MSVFKFIKKDKPTGFTIVEMVIIAPIVILVIGVFIFAVVKMTGDVMATRSSNTLAYDLQDALNRIEQDIALSKEFLASTNIAMVSPQGADNSSLAFNGWPTGPIILNSYANSSNPLNSTRNLIYLNNMPNHCSDNLLKTKNTTLMTNIVYFIDPSTKILWRRVIMPANYASIGCDTPWQQPSCSYAATINNTSCKIRDIKVIDNVTAFSKSLYKKDQVTPASTPTEAEVMKITITSSFKAAGRDISQTGTIRATKLNDITAQ